MSSREHIVYTLHARDALQSLSLVYTRTRMVAPSCSEHFCGVLSPRTECARWFNRRQLCSNRLALVAGRSLGPQRCLEIRLTPYNHYRDYMFAYLYVPQHGTIQSVFLKTDGKSETKEPPQQRADRLRCGGSVSTPRWSAPRAQQLSLVPSRAVEPASCCVG